MGVRGICYTDHLGTPQAMTNAAQAIVWNAKVEPFGKVLIKNQTVVNNIRLLGQYFDQETGLSQNGFRDGYDSGSGRYTQVDPIGMEGGLNLYAYVEGNPLSYVDPLGLAKKGRFTQQCGRCTVTYDSDQFKGAHTHWQCPGQPQGCVKKDGTPCDGSAPPPPEVKECLEKWGRIPVNDSNAAPMCGENCKKVWETIRDGVTGVLIFTFVLVCAGG